MKTPEEKASTESFFKDLDERSHGQADDLYAPDPQQMNNHLMAAFRQFFIKMGHEAHYKMMMRI